MLRGEFKSGDCHKSPSQFCMARKFVSLKEVLEKHPA